MAGYTSPKPIVLNAAVIDQLHRLATLAPLHQPANLKIVALASERLPMALQIGAFDTAFHAGRPNIDRLYALPRSLGDDGIVAHGFHGLPYAHIAVVLRVRDGPRGGDRAIVENLGSGASMCARPRYVGFHCWYRGKCTSDPRPDLPKCRMAWCPDGHRVEHARRNRHQRPRVGR